MLIAICLATFVVLVLIANAYRSQSSDMPLVSTCSAAISAACHAPLEDKEAYLLPVQWGIISEEGEGPARCSFTTLRTVRAPRSGDIILGLPRQGDGFKRSPKTRVREWVLRLRRLSPKNHRA